MQRLRLAFKLGLPMAGMFVAFVGVVYFTTDSARILSVLVGILLVEAGVWNLAARILPSTRRHLQLRAEVEGFVARIPELNAVAVDARSSNSPHDWERYRAVLSELHASVDRMGQFAGVEEGMPLTQPPPAQAGPA